MPDMKLAYLVNNVGNGNKVNSSLTRSSESVVAYIKFSFPVFDRLHGICSVVIWSRD